MTNKLVTGQFIWNYVQDLHQNGWEGIPYDAEEAILRHPKWELVELLIEDLNYGRTHKPVVLEYAKMETDLPPIVVNADNWVLDGYHRAEAAKERGNKTILAYVPIDILT